jgi:hypothetical protein
MLESGLSSETLRTALHRHHLCEQHTAEDLSEGLGASEETQKYLTTRLSYGNTHNAYGTAKYIR